MDNQDKKPKSNKAVSKSEEPSTAYKVTKKQGIGEDFDFDAEFEKGLTPEEFKAEMLNRIKTYPWKK